MAEPTSEVRASTIYLLGLAYALRDALAEMADEMACPVNAAHYCANCGHSLYRAKVIAAECRARIASTLEAVMRSTDTP